MASSVLTPAILLLCAWVRSPRHFWRGLFVAEAGMHAFKSSLLNAVVDDTSNRDSTRKPKTDGAKDFAGMLERKIYKMREGNEPHSRRNAKSSFVRSEGIAECLSLKCVCERKRKCCCLLVYGSHIYMGSKSDHHMKNMCIVYWEEHSKTDCRRLQDQDQGRTQGSFNKIKRTTNKIKRLLCKKSKALNTWRMMLTACNT